MLEILVNTMINNRGLFKQYLYCASMSNRLLIKNK